ncbi:MAG: type II toxin-antitoxin system HicA family toxin [archaeon]|nr:type II toxin-antitoxin system HicA family toxin [archaeon]
MEKLPIISGKELLKILYTFGFEPIRQKGSHVRIKKKTEKETIVSIVPLHKKLDIGTLNGILKQCSITKEEFFQKYHKR